MQRESLNVTLTASLRRAQIRPRLDTLAEHTGFTATQIAGRALVLGLGLIESDPRRIFPGQAEGNLAPLIMSAGAALNEASPQHVAPPSTAPLVEQPSAAAPTEMSPSESRHSEDRQRETAASPPLLDGTKSSAKAPRWVSTADTAKVLGYNGVTAFLEHSRRHPELRKLSKKRGRVRMWDLGKLRAEYERRKWQPR